MKRPDRLTAPKASCRPCSGSGKRHSIFDPCRCSPRCEGLGVCAACRGGATPKDARATRALRSQELDGLTVELDSKREIVSMRWGSTPLPQPTDREQARAWLKWASENHHAAGCACRGCIKAREMLRDRLCSK